MLSDGFHLWTENFCSFFAPKVAFSNLSGIVWTRPELPIYFFLIQRVNDLQKKNCVFGSLSLLHLIGGTLATKLISAYMRARICICNKHSAVKLYLLSTCR